jgi:tetratricopeptide (TPR) repeat protein
VDKIFAGEMMQYDDLGNAVSDCAPQTLQGINDFVSGFLRYEQQISNIVEAADAAPEHCLANTYAAMIWMFLEAPDGPVNAAHYAKRAQAAAPKASRREQMGCQVLTHWQKGDVQAALRVGEDIADEFPRDLAMVKLHQYMNFNRGDAPAMLRIAKTVAPHNQDVAHMHGMSAFAFEQCHLLDDAQACAERALQMEQKEPWAQHALAHVLLTRGQIDEGARFLEQASNTWTGLNSFMLTHNYWHLAVFYISQGKMDAALSLYDTQCWGVEKDYSQDQIGAVSLLARLELAGVDVGDRWADVGQYLRARATDTTQPFLSMQYLLGLARAGLSEADDLMQAVCMQAQNAAPFERAAWREVAVPACEGLLAYAREDYEPAINALGQALPRMMEIGGSHAQRDLFEQIMLDCVIKTKRLVTAQQMLEIRRGFDPKSVPLNAALAQVYQNLGLADEAARAAARIA